MEIVVDKDWWQITEFATEISKVLKETFNDDTYSVHYNTVDKWFKAMEENGIHYVTRKNGEKVYTTLDLHIACFVAEARKSGNYRLEVIYRNVPNNLEVRPFPKDSRGSGIILNEEGMVITKEEMMKEMMDEVMASVKGMATSVEFQQMLSEQIQQQVKSLLPQPPSKEEERAQRMDDVITRTRVERLCEEKAIEEWDKLPEEQRMKKAGWFRKEEDYIKRDNYIRAYKKEHLHRMLEEAYNIE